MSQCESLSLGSWFLTQAESVGGPSPATLSRARYKLDVLGMYLRRWQWSQTGFKPFFITLCGALGCVAEKHGMSGHTHKSLDVCSIPSFAQAMMRRSKDASYSSLKNTEQCALQKFRVQSSESEFRSSTFQLCILFCRVWVWSGGPRVFFNFMSQSVHRIKHAECRSADLMDNFSDRILDAASGESRVGQQDTSAGFCTECRVLPIISMGKGFLSPKASIQSDW